MNFSLQRLSQKQRLVLFVLWLIGTSAIALWLILARISLVGSFVAWEEETFGGIYPKTTFAVVWVSLHVVFGAVWFLVDWIRRKS